MPAGLEWGVTPEDPVLVWGGGAIGGTLAATWARAGIPVHMVDVQAEHVQACRTSGLRIHGPVTEFVQVVPAFTPQEPRGSYSTIVLAAKAQATDRLLYLSDAAPEKRRVGRGRPRRRHTKTTTHTNMPY